MVRLCRRTIAALAVWIVIIIVTGPAALAQNRIIGARPYVGPTQSPREASSSQSPLASSAQVAVDTLRGPNAALPIPVFGRLIGVRPQAQLAPPTPGQAAPIRSPNGERNAARQLPAPAARQASATPQAAAENAARSQEQSTAEPAQSELEAAQLDVSKMDVPTIMPSVEARPISLIQCVHTSIASRRIFNSFSGGVVIEQLTAFDPQISDQQVITELSRFDPSLTALLAGNHIDRPPSSFFGPGIQQNSRLDEGEFMTRLTKIWPTGTNTSIGYEPSLAYLYFPLGNTSGFNPTHSSDLVTRVTQPLLRGGNRDANLATLRVAQQRSNISRLQVEAAMQAQLRSVEQVYWKLHADHVRLKAIDEAITLAWRTRELVRLRVEAERSIYSDLARAYVNLEDLFQQRLEAEMLIRRSSFDLSQLVGLELGDSTVLVPIDVPERQPPDFDADAVVATAVSGNLGLKRQRQEIDIARRLARASGNLRLPQLDLQALHRTSGLQDDVGSALHQMIGFEYNDYTLGLQYTQQLGYRQANSRYRALQLQAARQAALLTAQERQVGFDVLSLLNQLKQSYGSYESAMRQLAQAQRWVELAQTRYENPPMQTRGGESLLVLLVDYQTALQAKVDAITQVAERLAEFNGLLAAIAERRGTTLEKWFIVINSDDELDLCSTSTPAGAPASPPTGTVPGASAPATSPDKNF